MLLEMEILDLVEEQYGIDKKNIYALVETYDRHYIMFIGKIVECYKIYDIKRLQNEVFKKNVLMDKDEILINIVEEYPKYTYYMRLIWNGENDKFTGIDNNELLVKMYLDKIIKKLI